MNWTGSYEALEKDRARRYETVNALTRDLERLPGSRSGRAGPSSATYRLRKLAARHRVGLAMAATFRHARSRAVVSTWMAVRASRAERGGPSTTFSVRRLAQASASTQARADTSLIRTSRFGPRWTARLLGSRGNSQTNHWSKPRSGRPSEEPTRILVSIRRRRRKWNARSSCVGVCWATNMRTR